MSRAVIVCVAIAMPAAADAQPTPAAQAEILFEQGKQLMTEGQIAAACAAFESSQKLEAAITTLLNLANCREKNQQLATAWALFLEAERQTRETDKDLNAIANERAASLAPRVSKLTLVVEEGRSGVEIRRDGQIVVPATWNTALPIDGGRHTISASANGYQTWQTEVTIENERGARTIEVPELVAAAAPPPARRRSRAVPITFGIGALALAGGAVGFELSARSVYERGKTEVDNAKQESLRESANTRRYVALGLGAAGIACAGVAVFTYLRVRRGESRVVPSASASSAGLTLVGTW